MKPLSFLEFFERAVQMPELAHGCSIATESVPSGPQTGGTVARAVVRGEAAADFDPEKSDVLAWIEQHFSMRELAHLVFWVMRQSGVLRYDRETKKWHGDPAYLLTYKKNADERLAHKSRTRAMREQARAEKKAKWEKLQEERRQRRIEAAKNPKPRPGRKSKVPEMIVADMVGEFVDRNKRQPARWELVKLIRDKSFMQQCACDQTISYQTFSNRLKWAKNNGQLVVKDGLLCFPPTPAQLAAEAAEREARAAEKAAKEAAKAAEHADREAEIERLRKLTAKLDDRPTIEQQEGNK